MARMIIELEASDIPVEAVKTHPHLVTEDTIATTLDKLFQAMGGDYGRLVVLPSLTELTTLFGVSHLIIHDAFQALRKKHYDYTLTGLDTAITFWKSLTQYPVDPILQAAQTPEELQAEAPTLQVIHAHAR